MIYKKLSRKPKALAGDPTGEATFLDLALIDPDLANEIALGRDKPLDKETLDKLVKLLRSTPLLNQ